MAGFLWAMLPYRCRSMLICAQAVKEGSNNADSRRATGTVETVTTGPIPEISGYISHRLHVESSAFAKPSC